MTDQTTVPPSDADVHVRRAGTEDAGAVHTLLLELATHERSAHHVRASAEDWRRMLADPAVTVLLALLAGEPVGYVSGVRQLHLWEGRDVFAMDDLYVRPHVRDRGIGGRLMASLAEHVGEDRPLITWGVNEDNHAGQRFYRRLGATLRTKTVAAWPAEAYSRYVQGPA
jgi:ribosomal protein S18 acetylase RimI-like enzyme